jgi:hypothetical protein
MARRQRHRSVGTRKQLGSEMAQTRDAKKVTLIALWDGKTIGDAPGVPHKDSAGGGNG